MVCRACRRFLPISGVMMRTCYTAAASGLVPCVGWVMVTTGDEDCFDPSSEPHIERSPREQDKEALRIRKCIRRLDGEQKEKTVKT